jgi:hypothetical protein
MTKSDSGTPDPDSGANQDDDAVWLDLVARLEATASGTDAGLDPGRAAGPAATGGRPARVFRDFDPLGLAVPPPVEPPAAGPPDSGPRDYEPDDDDGAFIPEEPPSLADSDPLTVLAWLGAVGAPIALLLSVIFWRAAPLLAVMGMVAAFAASVVFLIMKLPHEKDDHDDGARV